MYQGLALTVRGPGRRARQCVSFKDPKKHMTRTLESLWRTEQLMSLHDLLHRDICISIHVYIRRGGVMLSGIYL